MLHNYGEAHNYAIAVFCSLWYYVFTCFVVPLITIMRISETEFNHHMNGSSTPTVISFGAAWSGHSEMLFNILENLDNEFDSTVNFCLSYIDEYPDFANQWGIQEVPTTLIINNNEVVDYFVGLMPKKKIRRKISRQL